MGDITITSDNTLIIVQNELLVWKLWDEAHLPEYGTEWAACFDLKASLRSGDEVNVYNRENAKVKRTIVDAAIEIYPGNRVLIPTGLVFDLNEGESIRIHPRSGLALKNGIIVANCEGIVDADYVQQTYVMLHNISDQVFIVRDGDRIAQAEVAYVEQYTIVQSDREPEEKTSRSGGFGSTGV